MGCGSPLSDKLPARPTFDDSSSSLQRRSTGYQQLTFILYLTNLVFVMNISRLRQQMRGITLGMAILLTSFAALNAQTKPGPKLQVVGGDMVDLGKTNSD